MKLVFTNGCFDLLHPGHVDLLTRARALGDRLVVGLNSDASVRSIKGPGRPIMSQDDRAGMLRALRGVDEVVVFDEPTPTRLIAELKPDVLVKGGDWSVDQIVGADLVLAWGGAVHALPFLAGHSTTALVERLGTVPAADASRRPILDIALGALADHGHVMRAVGEQCRDAIERAGQVIIAALTAGHRLLLCGNGGSAADAEHIATEFVARFENDRRPYPAIALGGVTAVLTALPNDYGYDQMFARQVTALAQAGDVLVAISTSGTSPNVLAAAMAARKTGVTAVALTGAGGSRLAALCDVAVMVPSTRVSRVQEAHAVIGHIWCEMFDTAVGAADGGAR